MNKFKSVKHKPQGPNGDHEKETSALYADVTDLLSWSLYRIYPEQQLRAVGVGGRG